MPVDVTDVLRERKRLIAIIEEGKTAAVQIGLYNRLIVAKVGDKAMPGVDDDVDDAEFQLGVCPVEGCPGLDSSSRADRGEVRSTPQLLGAMVRHVQAKHPDYPHVDRMREALRQGGKAPANLTSVDSGKRVVLCPVRDCNHPIGDARAVRNHLRLKHSNISQARRDRIADQIKEEMAS